MSYHPMRKSVRKDGFSHSSTTRYTLLPTRFLRVILFLMKHIISSTLYLIILLCLSKFVFDPTHLYYELPWLDIPMHIMGGFGVASLVTSIANYKKKNLSFTSVLLLYLCVAIGWELYEFAQDLYNGNEWGGWSDTLSDIFNGGVGASVAYYLLKK